MSSAKHKPLNDQLCFSLYAANMAINQAHKPMLSNLGITYPQYLVLSALQEQDSQTISALASRVVMDVGIVTTLVKRMEWAGLLERIRNDADRRQVLVSLTPKGKDLLATTDCLTETLLGKSGFARKEIVAFNFQIQKLRDLLASEAKK